MKTLITICSLMLLVSCYDKSKESETDLAFERHDLEMKRHQIIQDSLFYYYDLNADLQEQFWKLYYKPGNAKKLINITEQMEVNGKKCDALIDRFDMPLESDTITF